MGAIPPHAVLGKISAAVSIVVVVLLEHFKKSRGRSGKVGETLGAGWGKALLPGCEIAPPSPQRGKGAKLRVDSAPAESTLGAKSKKHPRPERCGRAVGRPSHPAFGASPSLIITPTIPRHRFPRRERPEGARARLRAPPYSSRSRKNAARGKLRASFRSS